MLNSLVYSRRLARPVVALGLVVGLFAGRTPALADSNSAIGFAPDSVTATPGDSFSVDVVVNLSQEIRGAQFGMKFDPAVVTIASVSEGPYLKEWAKAHHGQSAAAVPFQVDNSRGEVSIGGIIILGGDSNGGPSGPGVLATVKGTVKPDAAASSALTLTAVKFASTAPDAAGVPNVSVVAGGVAVGSAPVPPADPSGGLAPQSTGVAVQSDQSVIVSPGDSAPAPAPDSAPGGQEPTTASTPTTEAASAASLLGDEAIYHDVMMQADSNEPAPIIVPANAPVFSSDVNAQATAVAAAATATALTKAVVAVTPPSLQQPQAPAGVANQPTPRPLPAVGQTASQSDRVIIAPTPAAPRSINQSLRPAGSPGVFLPWEVIAGIGGGIVAAGLVLVGLRRAPGRPQV